MTTRQSRLVLRGYSWLTWWPAVGTRAPGQPRVRPGHTIGLRVQRRLA